MNIYVAVIIALLAGIAAAWFAYGFKKSVSTHRVLALLRWMWTAMLVYAFLSVPTVKEITTEMKLPVTLMIDTSSSLGEPLEPALEQVQMELGRQGVPYHVRSFDASAIPSTGQWMYFGDGHIQAPAKQAPKPVAAVFFNAKPLDPIPLISGISVPATVRAGSTFRGLVQASAQAAVNVAFENQMSRSKSFAFRAPKRPGFYEITTIAQAQERMDTVTIGLEVVEHFSTWLVISNAPHPHEGMIRRYARREGIAVSTISMDELKESWLGPTVIIGSSPKLESLVATFCKGPIWRMSAASAEGMNERSVFEVASFPTGKGAMQGELRATGEQARLKLANRTIESRGIHWYASVLENETNGELFEELCATMQVWHTPNRIEVNVPQRWLQGQKYQISAAVVGGSNRPLEAIVNAVVRTSDGQIVDRPVLRSEGNGYTWEAQINRPGKYRIDISATIGEADLETRRYFEVDRLNIEAVRDFNASYWNASQKEGTVIVNGTKNWEDTALEWETKERTIAKKNPQHNTWWYWGLALLIAALEWFNRRRQGMV